MAHESMTYISLKKHMTHVHDACDIHKRVPIKEYIYSIDKKVFLSSLFHIRRRASQMKVIPFFLNSPLSFELLG